MILQSNDFLKSQTLVTIQKMDDAAILIAMLLQALPHDNIGLMCVDADVVDLTLAIVQKCIQNTM